MTQVENNKSKNKYNRKMQISNFRNLGIGDKPAELILNRSLKKEELGGLVFLVGPNNSGKSNVINALLAYDKNEVLDEDTPDFSYVELVPKIDFVVRSDSTSYVPLATTGLEECGTRGRRIDISAWDKLTDSPLLYTVKKMANEEAFKEVLETKAWNFTQDMDGFFDYIDYLEEILKNAYTEDSFEGEHLDLLEPFVGTRAEYEEQYGSSGVDFMNYVKNRDYRYYSNPQQVFEDSFTREIIIDAESEQVLAQQKIDSASFRNTWEYNLVPNFVVYNQEKINQMDLTCSPDSPNRFIKTVLKLLGRNEDALGNIYDRYRPKKQMNLLSSFERELNKDIGKITERFNSLYFCGEGEKYEFRLKATSMEFGMEIYRGDIPLDLDKQSTGFRWFFDFFFNFMCENDLEFGDIILMDEPATSLHVSGVIELRNYLYEFAKQNGLTFVISTHSPFFLNCDYLDEVRIMTRDAETGHVQINNRFTVIGDENLDTLDHVLNGLTVGRHILIDPNQKVIFTEGITDYSYLVAFKHLFAPKYDTLTFLPINGIKREDLFQALLRIDKSPILLVDGDGAGKEVKNASDGTGVTVLSLEDIGKSGYKEIENLFTVEDRKQFNLYDKGWDEAIVFKNNISENADKLSETTKGRFEELLNFLHIA